MLPIAAAALLLSLTPPAPRQAVHLPATQTDTAVARIRREYMAVNAMLPRCAVRTLEVSGESTEGGEMKVYRCGGEIRKLAVTYYGESGKASEEWYLSGGRPFFLFRTDSHYDRPLSGRVARQTEERAYLRAGRMVRWIEGTRTRPVSSADARRRTGELAATIADLLDRARTGRTEGK